jgi:hypothetical protein
MHTVRACFKLSVPIRTLQLVLPRAEHAFYQRRRIVTVYRAVQGANESTRPPNLSRAVTVGTSLMTHVTRGLGATTLL